MGKYDSMTNEEFDNILDDVVHDAGMVVVRSIPGVEELIREYFNNEVLKSWEEKKYGTAVVKLPGSDVFHEISGDYDLEDEDEDGLLYVFTSCGKDMSGELHYDQKVTCKACLRTGAPHE